MKLTVPQILMMNHAAHINFKRQEKNSKNKKKNKGGSRADMYKGKKIEDLSTEEYIQYFAGVKTDGGIQSEEKADN